MGNRTYVLDTRVLVADPHSIVRLDEHDAVLPLVVVEELDRHKTRMDAAERNVLLLSSRHLSQQLRLGCSSNLRISENDAV